MGYRPRHVKDCKRFRPLIGFELSALKADGFGVQELRDDEGYSLQQLASCFSVRELRINGNVSADELIHVGYSLEEICAGGFGVTAPSRSS